MAEEDEEEEDLPLRNDDDSPEARLICKLDKLQIEPDERVFLGKSSTVMLVKTALDIKYQCQVRCGTETSVPIWSRPHIRHEFLYPRSWQLRPSKRPCPTCQPEALDFHFPDADLLHRLVELYFEHVNLFLPLLHRPTFKQHIKDGLHLRDQYFAYVLLLVLGLASRYSEDPRVLVDGTNDLHSAGWKYVGQVINIRPAMSVRPSLFEVQAYCLYTLWIDGSSMPQGTWTEIGVALRRAMEVGAHRRKQGKPTTQRELWKRAFWILLCQDVYLSALYGQNVTLSSDMYDQDLPVACDDEYWDTGDPETSFKQPEGELSTVSYFNKYIELMEIYGTAIRSLYYTKKPTLSTARPTDQQTVTMLDSALNGWLDQLPIHLKWNPKEKDRITFEHAACLYTTYLHVQIFVHKPFITALDSRSKLNFPSLAICTSAARACASVMDARTQRDAILLPQFHITVAVAGFILVLGLWTGKQARLTPNPRDLDDVYKCMRMLRACEARWHSAGRNYDCLRHLANAADVGMPTWEVYENAQRKRKRGAEEDNAGAQASQDGTSATPNSWLGVVTPQTSWFGQAAGGAAIPNDGVVTGNEGVTGVPSSAEQDEMLDFITAYAGSQQFSAGTVPLGDVVATFDSAAPSSIPPLRLDNARANVVSDPLNTNPQPLSVDTALPDINAGTWDSWSPWSQGLAPYDDFEFSFSMPAPSGLNMLIWDAPPIMNLG
ncbi:fungal-specific transcription factor domain-containing protein [Schizophyllum fasciatum]